VSEFQIELMDALLMECLFLRGICRAVKMSLYSLMKYIDRLYKNQPDNLNYRIPNTPEINLQLIGYQLYKM
jgi:hypothetical protein